MQALDDDPLGFVELLPRDAVMDEITRQLVRLIRDVTFHELGYLYNAQYGSVTMLFSTSAMSWGLSTDT